MSGKSNWTDERADKLRELWLAGHSAAEIARALGGTSRQTVCAKAARLGLPGRGSPIVNTNIGWAAAHAARTAEPTPPPAVRAPEPLPRIPLGFGAAALERLGSRACRFPHGDPKHADFRFCGADTGSVMRSYCAECSGLAYAPMRRVVVPITWRGGQVKVFA